MSLAEDEQQYAHRAWDRHTEVGGRGLVLDHLVLERHTAMINST